MHRLNIKKALAVAVVLGLGLSGELAAQDTTSAIRGRILGTNGAPLANASITVEDSRTGAERTFQSNETGTFYAANLPVGGPYTVTVNGSRTVTIQSIALGDIYNLTVDLGPATQQIEEILVVGSSRDLLDTAPGPSATYDTFAMQTSVAFDRDIRDVYALDPRINLSGEYDDVNCAGKHPRFNSVSLDGVSQNDRFGLNENGYSTATGMPFPYEAIAQVAVELAPFDVTYGGFTACNINAVTKSGSNEWDGTVFYESTGDNFRGDSLTVDGDIQDLGSIDYEETKLGFSVGGPLIQDRLFIYGAYEETEEPRFLAMGYDGSGNGVERSWLSEADYNRIASLAESVYDYDAGGQPSDGVQEEEKYMLRLDWNINNDHDLAFIYNYYDGFQDRASDDSSNEFEFANHFYVKGAESETSTLKLSSQWSNNFSTEFFYSMNTMDDSQVTTGPQDFAEFQVSIGSNIVYLGADDSRQANSLNTESDYFKAMGQYLAGEHVLTFGYEREALQIFNQFVQHAQGGEYRFFDDSGSNPAYCDALDAAGRFADAGCSLSGIDKMELGRPDRIYYGSGGGSNNPDDAAALFENTLNTLYLQDEYYFAEHELTLTAGLRYEWFESDDRPSFNQTFTTANGIRNDGNIDGLDLLMPRLGFVWEATQELSLRGGLGLYSGGNPNVWISNAWSNDGITNVQVRFDNDSDDSFSVLDGSIPLNGTEPGRSVPQELYDEVADTTAADASDSFLVLIDPDYEQPSEWKFALGGTYRFDNDLTLDVDLLHSRQNDPAYYVDLSQEVVGTTSNGQPIYDYVTGADNYMLTNSDKSGKATTISFVLNQEYDWGLDWMLGYAWSDAEDVSPMTSSVAASNFDNLALYDLNNPDPGASNYLSEHTITARVSYGIEFIDDHETRVTALFYRSQGQPQSYVMGSQDLEGDGFYGRHLLYVPAFGDTNVVYDAGFDQEAFNAWVADQGLARGQYVERNGTHAKWSSRMDLRVDQEIPTFMDGTRGRAYMKIYNVLNLLDDEWGHQYDAQFFSQQVVDSSVNASGQYVFEEFNQVSVNDLLENRSLWEIRLGLQFEF